MRRIKLKDWLWAFTGALMFLAWHGYIVDSGDQAEHLPPVYKLLNPSLYPGDYYVEAIQNQFTVRSYYISVLAFLGEYLPIHPLLFVLTFLSIAVSVYACIQLSVSFGLKDERRLLPPVLVFIVFENYWSIGGNKIQETQFICGTPALAAGFLAIALFFSGRPVRAFILSGAAAIFHVMVSVHVFLILSVLLLFGTQQFKRRQYIQSFLLYGVFAAPMLIPMILRQADTPFYGMDPDTYYTVLYRYRNFHHFIPSLFPVMHYVKFGVICGLTTFLLLRYKERFHREIASVLVLFWAGFVVYAVAVETGIFYSAGKFQWPKMSVWVSAVCIVWSSCQVLKKYTKERRIPEYYSLIVALPSVAVLFFSAYMPVSELRENRMVGKYEETALTKVHHRIRREIPSNALFIVPPGDDSFSCESERSALTGYRAVIHEPWFIVHWFETFSSVYHVPLEQGRNANVLPLASQNYRNLAPPEVYLEKATHLLTEPGVNWPAGLGKMLFTEGGYRVWEIRR